MTPLQVQLKGIWRRLSRPDLIAASFARVGADLLLLARSGATRNFLKYAALLSAGYLLVRFIGWWRARLLWSLRNRLIVAYLFVALVPVVLVLMLAIQAGKLLYAQLGGYLLYDDMQYR